MQVSNWISELKPYLRDLSTEEVELLKESSHGIFYRLHVPKCTTAYWRLQVATEPVFRRTHWKAIAIFIQNSSEFELMVFDANELGWNYPDVKLANFLCSCGDNQFQLMLIFEHYEESDTKDDMSWFWLWAKCASCNQRHKIVDWELD